MTMHEYDRTRLLGDPIRSVCVYCGSKTGKRTDFVQATRQVGSDIAKAGLKLIYGGGGTGLMGVLARAALAEGGYVTGIIPAFLREAEAAFDEVNELVITASMHERKQRMFELADGFMVLPGGIGTLEETVEMITWRQLGQHLYPVIIVNIDGYWNPLVQLLTHFVAEEFTGRELTDFFRVVTRAEDAVPALLNATCASDRF
jgi:uncharacterized protein (TIGR00730 family)